jgi:predicted  nucleic acid-binding Zn-ribbon protein
MIRPNKAMQKFIENERYLSDEEKSLKKQLKDSLRDFLDLNEQFQDVKNSFDLDCHNHFQEIRRKIDVQREELKDQIDKIALTMIDEIKEMEQKHSKSLNEFKVEIFDFDKEKKILNETFRDVNLSIESIKMLKSKQDETITSIKSKINEINKLKKVVLKSNDFKANLACN